MDKKRLLELAGVNENLQAVGAWLDSILNDVGHKADRQPAPQELQKSQDSNYIWRSGVYWAIEEINRQLDENNG